MPIALIILLILFIVASFWFANKAGKTQGLLDKEIIRHNTALKEYQDAMGSMSRQILDMAKEISYLKKDFPKGVRESPGAVLKRHGGL